MIGGNTFAGVWIHGVGTAGNVVAGDLIGTNVTGDAALPNARRPYGASGFYDNVGGGVIIDSGASDNRIGGDSLGPDGPGPDGFGEGNLISGNANVGVELSGIGTSENVVAGDLIGTLTGGINALGNGQQGVQIDSGASHNTIGGTVAAARDVISGNGWDAVHILDPGTTGNVVEGDYLGVAADGEVPLGNVAAGVAIYGGASGNVVGGMAPGSGDVISANHGFGVYISDASTADNRVEGDLIGTDASGSLGMGNRAAGVILQYGASDNTIGGTGAAARDVISNNGWDGVDIGFAGTTGNVVAGDYIGITADGSGRLPNSYSGVAIYGGAGGNVIGGTDPGSGDVLSSSVYYGVYISDAGTNGNVVEGDLIGTDSTGTQPLFNVSDGVIIQDGASDNTIGGTARGAGNVISNTGEGDGTSKPYGIQITGSGTSGNVVRGNRIGFDVTGTLALPNEPAGIEIDGGAAHNTIGGLTGVGDDAGFDFASGSSSAVASLGRDSGGPSWEGAAGDSAVSYVLDVETVSLLKVTVRGGSATSRLILLDPWGRVVVVSDGTSASDRDPVIEEHLPAGDYTLELMSAGGLGPFVLDAMLTPSSSPAQPVWGPAPGGYMLSNYNVATGDFNGDGIPDVATSDGVFLGLGDGTFQPTPVAASLPEPNFATASSSPAISTGMGSST